MRRGKTTGGQVLYNTRTGMSVGLAADGVLVERPKKKKRGKKEKRNPGCFALCVKIRCCHSSAVQYCTGTRVRYLFGHTVATPPSSNCHASRGDWTWSIRHTWTNLVGISVSPSPSITNPESEIKVFLPSQLLACVTVAQKMGLASLPDLVATTSGRRWVWGTISNPHMSIRPISSQFHSHPHFRLSLRGKKRDTTSIDPVLAAIKVY